MQQESGRLSDAVDPQASSTGTPTTRASCSNCSHLIAALRAMEQEMTEEVNRIVVEVVSSGDGTAALIAAWRDRLSSLTGKE